MYSYDGLNRLLKAKGMKKSELTKENCNDGYGITGTCKERRIQTFTAQVGGIGTLPPELVRM